jgi:hypothetical protein
MRQRDAAIPATRGNVGGAECPNCKEIQLDPAALGKHLNRPTNDCTITSAADRNTVEDLGLQQCSKGDCKWWGKNIG